MALHFSGNQYEQAYKPRVLRNWEIPKRYNDKPLSRKGRTEIISNDRGHLLPGVSRSKSSPWGNFVGTWHLPKKISRKTADELNGTAKQTTCEEKRKKKQTTEIVEVTETEVKEQEVKSETLKDETVEATPAEEPVKERSGKKVKQYTPGDLTDEKHRFDYEISEQNNDNRPKGYPRARDDFSGPPEEVNECKNEETEEFRMSSQQRHSKLSTPIITAIKNFQLAKKFHRQNLEHDPLPDTIANAKYRKLQMQRSCNEPGLALSDEVFATGVGWKGYPGYGPTRCTKLKVYRPKTCAADLKNDGKPDSVTSFDRKWRFIRQRKVTPMELAICWDLTPENPKDEPKRTLHIDGSNGSQAPAVFSLVNTPKDDDSRKSSFGTDIPLFEKAPLPCIDEKDFVLDRPKTGYHVPDQVLSRKRSKSAYCVNREEYFGAENIHQSTPNLNDCVVKNSRLCMACEMKNVSIKDKTKKDEYKMAFKAGVPQKCKDKRQDYPDHWRLATVYQHSYKPIHTRKRPLLATVFK